MRLLGASEVTWVDRHNVAVTLMAAIGMVMIAVALCWGDPLPDPKLTHCVIRKDISENQVCKIKWGKDERAVSEAMKAQVFRSYGYPRLDKDPRCPCEIDHLCSRELLGADVVANLWPQSYRGPCNAHHKDRLENHLHQLVCAGKISLRAAQQAIASNWVKAYKQYVDSGGCG